MNAISEFQIYIGSLDSQLNTELVNENEFKEMVVRFFKHKEIAFSMYRAVGGFLHENGDFVAENSMCINIIGARDLDIVSLAKSLSMFMNQECSLVVKNIVKTEYC
jgi:hypothetical protein